MPVGRGIGVIVEWARYVGHGDGRAGRGAVDIDAGIEGAEIFLGGVETLGKNLDGRGVGHL